MPKILVIYLPILIFYLYSVIVEITLTKTENSDPILFGTLDNFKLFYFTGWTFGMQIFFLITAILDESSKLLNLPLDVQKRFSRTRAFVFSTFVFPCSLLVMTVFWTIWHIDRELIFPKAIDEFFPVWLNHTIHTFIAVPLIVEMLLPKKYSFVRFERAAVILAVYAIFYQCLYLSVYLRHGVWLYPIYKILDWPQRLLFSLLQLAVCLLYLKIGIVIQNRKRIHDNIMKIK